MPDLKIGIIGIGAFGSRAAMRLLWQGYHDLMVYDTHEQTPRVFTGTFGGLSLGSPKMIAQICDIVITCLPSAADTFTASPCPVSSNTACSVASRFCVE